jgi:tRNA threonylcarbamoyladenosine biosynthesis protein TsaE
MARHRIETLTDLSDLARGFLDEYPSGAVVGLSGGLGAGKTAFVRECILELAKRKQSILPKVVSPSFVLNQSYAFGEIPVEHFDLYRLEGVDEATLLNLGYYEAWQRVQDGKGYLFVEWSERAQPSRVLGLTLHVQVEMIDTVRTFEISVLPAR